jgi:hypothetical protein
MTINGVPINVDTISAVGLCVLFVLGIAMGRLFTKRQYDEVIHDRDEWRAESRIKDAQIAEKDVQLQHLAAVGHTVEQLARGLQQEMGP